MRRLIEWEVLYCTIPGGTKKLILLNETHKDFLDFFVMYKTEMSRVNIVKDVRREGIKLHTNF